MTTTRAFGVSLTRNITTSIHYFSVSQVRSVATSTPAFGVPVVFYEVWGSVQCCFTFTETVRTIRDAEPWTAASTFTQLLSSGLRRINVCYLVCCRIAGEVVCGMSVVKHKYAVLFVTFNPVENYCLVLFGILQVCGRTLTHYLA